MQFPDCTPQAVPRFGSVVQSDTPVQLPLGSAKIGRNITFTPQGVVTRSGFTKRLTFGAQGNNLSGIESIRYLANDNSGAEIIKLLGYTRTDGNIWGATPFQQGSVEQLSSDGFVAQSNLPRVPGLNPFVTQAFNKGILAMGDGTHGKAPNMIYDPNADTIDQVSDKPFGVAWNPGTAYRVGHMVSPSTFETFGLPAAQGVYVAKRTGHLYRCIGAGTSNPTTQPIWPLTEGAIFSDGTVTWEEHTPDCLVGLPDPSAPIAAIPTSHVDSASAIVPGATIFIALTYVNASGGEGINELVNTEGVVDPNRVFQFTNTTLSPVSVSVITPPIPTAVGTSGPLADAGAVGFNVYAYISTGPPDVSKFTDPTFYAQVSGGPFTPIALVTIDSFPTGQALPTINTASVSADGNVDTGIRYMVWFFVTRTNYQTGFSSSVPIRVNVSQGGRRARVDNVPIGPYNCIARIAAFTVAGAGAAGPYFFVDQDDTESPGFNEADVPITATRINDNTTTTAEFNFTDTYLPGASEVTEYFNRVEVPGASHAYFSQTLQQVIYTGCQGFPSGFLVSDPTDPEAVRIPGSNLQCAESDGDRTVGWKEIRENQIALKENSGHAVVPNDGDPSTWAVHRLWSGSGPAGAKAVDVATEDQADFMVYAHESGPYRYVGGSPQLVGKEVGAIVNTPAKGLWKRINWDFGYKIVTKIDISRREVRFSVPLDGATENNQVITLSYALGWDDAVIFIVRTGREVPNINGRRWSVDDLQALDFCYVPQRQQTTTAQAGVDLNANMMMCSADGALYTLTEGQWFDQNWTGANVGFFSQWVSVPGPNPTMAIFSVQGASLGGTGNGVLNVYADDEKNRRVPISTATRVMTLTAAEQQRDFGLVGIQGCKWGIGFDNGGVAGAGFSMNTAILWLRKFADSRIG